MLREIYMGDLVEGEWRFYAEELLDLFHNL